MSLVPIASYPDAPAAYVARARLEAEGIPAFVLDEHIVGVAWLWSQALGGVKLQVDAADAARAREILTTDAAEAESSQAGVPPEGPEDAAERCPACGAPEVARDHLAHRSRALSLLVGWIGGIAVPFGLSRRRRRCRVCGARWKPAS